jgi:hypothetical protein
VFDQIADGAGNEYRKTIKTRRGPAPHLDSSLGENNSEFCQQSTDTVNGGVAFLDESLTHAMQGQNSRLVDALERHKSHARRNRLLRGNVDTFALPTTSMAHVIRRRSEAPRHIAGAKVAPFPGFIDTCLAT